MPSPKSLTLCLTLSLFASVASGCASKAPALQTYPPANLLVAEPKPKAGIDVVTSAQAHARYDVELETWGERRDAAVHAICVWAKGRGMPNAPC